MSRGGVSLRRISKWLNNTKGVTISAQLFLHSCENRLYRTVVEITYSDGKE
jgi:hypothetical protein